MQVHQVRDAEPLGGTTPFPVRVGVITGDKPTSCLDDDLR